MVRYALTSLALSCSTVICFASPDSVLINGNIYPEASQSLRFEAMAVGDDRIVALGDTKSIQDLAGPTTHVIDLKGRTVLPGFNDQHVHPLSASMRGAGCQINQGSDLS